MKKAIFILAVLLCSVISALNHVRAQELTIQGMINNATSGSVIEVPEGIYSENIVVNKTITLSTTSAEVHALNSSRSVFDVTANNVKISGFRISGACTYIGEQDPHASGILLRQVSGCEITGNYVSNNTMGINLHQAVSNHVWGNTIIANHLFCGIQLLWSNSNVVSFNTVTDNNYGIFLRASDGNTIYENNITESREGSPGGLHLVLSDNNILEENTINRTAGIFALSLNWCYNNLVRRNTVAHSGWWAISVCSGIADGIIHPNNNIIYMNNFIDNARQTYVINTTNFWDNGTKGNYWSTYTGVDLDTDGIGDTPYTIDTYNVDHFPLMTDPPLSNPSRPSKGSGAGRNTLV